MAYLGQSGTNFTLSREFDLDTIIDPRDHQIIEPNEPIRFIQPIEDTDQTDSSGQKSNNTRNSDSTNEKLLQSDLDKLRNMIGPGGPGPQKELPTLTITKADESFKQEKQDFNSAGFFQTSAFKGLGVTVISAASIFMLINLLQQKDDRAK